MPRRPRLLLGDGTFHVTARGNGGAALFLDNVDCRAFSRLLRVAAEVHDWRLHAYCLMPNHYHLVVATTGDSLRRGMRWLNGGYAQFFNGRHDRWGDLFGSRYDARLLADDERLDAVCADVAANPVRAGLCETVDEWPWTSVPLAAGRA